jgi:CRISPR-associated protein Csh1
MGFLDAISQMGALEKKEGIEAYLKFPLEGEGRVIRVFLDVHDPYAEVLQVLGVSKIDLADLVRKPEMVLKYLYRDRVGANTSWGFTPLHKIGRPKANVDGNKKEFFGESGSWQKEDKSHLYKIKNRVLADYEKEGVFSKGSVETIMRDLPSKIEDVLDRLDNKLSHIIIFGIDNGQDFLYPGDIPAFVNYFNSKLQRSLDSGGVREKKKCALCQRESYNTSTLNKVFKFATFDKVSFLPGLDKSGADSSFPLCYDCLEKVTSGRERVERTLTKTTLIPKVRIWVVPEGTGIGGSERLKRLVNDLERNIDEGALNTLGEQREQTYFQRLAREEQGLVFHFLFWERSNSQEIVHLMVEDVPPERLARLERLWETSMKSVFGDVKKGLNLDWTINSLYWTLDKLSGKSKSDKTVFKDFAINVIGKILKEEKLPVLTFKKFVVSRTNRLMHEESKWEDKRQIILYSQVWVNFMTMLNEEV